MPTLLSCFLIPVITSPHLFPQVAAIKSWLTGSTLGVWRCFERTWHLCFALSLIDLISLSRRYCLRGLSTKDAPRQITFCHVLVEGSPGGVAGWFPDSNLSSSTFLFKPLVAQQKRICLQCRRPGFNPWFRDDPLEKEMAAHCSILAWRIPWAEEPGVLWSLGSERVRHDWATNSLTSLFGTF